MSWFLLVLAGFCEVGFAVGLKYSHGFTRPVPAIVACVAMIVSLWLLSVAVRHIPVGTAYAVWTGIGAIGTMIVGMLLLGEPRSAVRIICLLLIAAGISGLKLFGAGSHPSVATTKAERGIS